MPLPGCFKISKKRNCSASWTPEISSAFPSRRRSPRDGASPSLWTWTGEAASWTWRGMQQSWLRKGWPGSSWESGNGPKSSEVFTALVDSSGSSLGTLVKNRLFKRWILSIFWLKTVTQHGTAGCIWLHLVAKHPNISKCIQMAPRIKATPSLQSSPGMFGLWTSLHRWVLPRVH